MGEESYKNLSAELRGSVIAPGDDDYEVARRVYNGMLARRPDAIVRCADVEALVKAVNFARKEGAPVAVRGASQWCWIGRLRPWTCIDLPQ
jgi:FAD/FMN-containing dehydrogenase